MGLCDSCKYNGYSPEDAQCECCGELSVKKCAAYDARRGHWLYNSFYGGFWQCSLCGHDEAIKKGICPACGAKMESEARNDSGMDVVY